MGSGSYLNQFCNFFSVCGAIWWVCQDGK